MAKIAKVTSFGVPLKEVSLLLIVTYILDNDVYPQCKFQVFWIDFGQVRVYNMQKNDGKIGNFLIKPS